MHPHYERANHLWHLYLSFGYVPAPYTFYNGISRLMPGGYLVVKKGKVSEHRYWDVPAVSEGDMRRDAENIYREFHEQFNDSVRIRMRSERTVWSVPEWGVGFLKRSGGDGPAEQVAGGNVHDWICGAGI